MKTISNLISKVFINLNRNVSFINPVYFSLINTFHSKLNNNPNMNNTKTIHYNQHYNSHQNLHQDSYSNKNNKNNSQSSSSSRFSSYIFQRFLFLIGLSVYLTRPSFFSIQDQQIRSLKKSLNTQISKLKQQYGQLSVYPDVKYQLRGNNYQIIFEIDQRKTDLFMLLSKCMTVYNNQKGFRVIDSKAYTNKDGLVTHYIEFEEQDPQFKTPQRGRITITGVNSSQRPSFRLIFNKNDTITPKNVSFMIQAYRQSVKPRQYRHDTSGPSISSPHRGHTKIQQQKSPQNQIYKKLQQFGVTVFDPKDKSINLDWDYLAGYESQKRSIQDTVLLALNYPQIYDEITQATRVKFQKNRPKAVLFEGPPGTGKTTSAKIIAQQVNIPLIYMPIQAIMSKYYGESQQKLADFWENCKKLGKVIIFIDQIDALAGSRQKDMHEASRRILSTLLRKIDSFQSTTDVLLVCATNRKQDLDPAMLSRIDLSIKFNLPDKHSRAAIFKRYAKHLQQTDLQFLAEETQGFSGRNISDVCKHAERRWASKLIRKQVTQKLPTLDQYIGSLQERKSSQLVI